MKCLECANLRVHIAELNVDVAELEAEIAGIECDPEVVAVGLESLEEFKSLARLCADMDCDEEAHRYCTPCRRCEAEKLVK